MRLYSKFYEYCFNGDLDNIIFLYYTRNINIRYKNDKIFINCCELLIKSNNNDKYKNILNVLLFLCTLCKDYYMEIKNNKLISYIIYPKYLITI